MLVDKLWGSGICRGAGMYAKEETKITPLFCGKIQYFKI